VIRGLIQKDSTMRSKLALFALASVLSGCGAGVATKADRGLATANIPVVTTADYVFDAAAPGGALAPGEPERLNGWFQGLGLGYGDRVYVDGAYSDSARAQVAQVAGRYGMLVQSGAPVTAGLVQPGSVRVVVSRRRAVVPGCPDWSGGDKLNYENRSMPGFGCAISTNYAAMIANPEDLIHGREGDGVSDTRTATKAVEYYRTTPPSASKGLKEVSTKDQ
jgi:pilus assembly protein CpaD